MNEKRPTEEIARSLSPCVDQTETEIANYYRSADIGAPAAVRQTQGGVLRYFERPIENRRRSSGRIYLADFGDFYMKSGKNCFEPTGQTRLVVPTGKVTDWARANPDGATGVSIYPDGGKFPG